MKILIYYICLSLIPIALILASMVILPLIMPSDIPTPNYTLLLFIALGVFGLFTIIFPIYLTILSKYYLINHDMNLGLVITMMIFSGIGSILMLNRERGSVNWDFKNEIAFFWQMIISGSILLIGIVILAYLKFKNH